jgi:hypothetical protein
MCLGCSWDRGVVVEKLPAAHMKIYLSIGGLGLSGSKWQQVAANRYFDSTIDAVKSRWCAPRRGWTLGPGAHERKEERRCGLIQNSTLEAFEGLATTRCRKRTTVALPSSQVEAGVMIRPVPPQHHKHAMHELHRPPSLQQEAPRPFGTDGEEEPGKLIGASGRQNLRDVDIPVIPQVS